MLWRGLLTVLLWLTAGLLAHAEEVTCGQQEWHGLLTPTRFSPPKNKSVRIAKVDAMDPVEGQRAGTTTTTARP
jgi:hypothetical protein